MARENHALRQSDRHIGGITMNRVRYLLSCCSILTGMSASFGAAAQDAATGSTLEEVVVTAQRRAEALQNVPISITVAIRRATRERRRHATREHLSHCSSRTAEPYRRLHAARHSRRNDARSPATTRTTLRCMWTATTCRSLAVSTWISSTSSRCRCSKVRRAPSSDATPPAARFWSRRWIHR